MLDTHPIIEKSDLNENNHLLDSKTIFNIRKLQLKYALQKGTPLRNEILFKKEDRFPVLIGREGETIVLYNRKYIGKGSFGTIWLGKSLDNDKLYAIKIQSQEFDKKAHVENEEEVLINLKRFIDRLDFTLEGKPSHIGIQSLVRGVDLVDYLNNNDASFLQKLNIAIQLLEEVAAIHAKHNYLHRDLKLENVIWDSVKNKLEIVDFALTKKMNSCGKVFDNQGCGSTIYIAPEIISALFGKTRTCGTYTVQTEMYACGMILFQLFTSLSPNWNLLDLISEVNLVTEQQISGVFPLLEELIINELSFETNITPFFTHMMAYIKQMLDINSDHRPDFTTAITELKKIKAQYEKFDKGGNETMLAKLEQLQTEVENLKQNFSIQYGKPIIEKACHEFFQTASKKDPQIFFITHAAINFYKHMADKKKFESIILEYLRKKTLEALPTLGLEEMHLPKATMFLQRFRTTQLKEQMKPGAFVNYLNQKGLLEVNPAEKTTTKVRFV